MTKQEALDRGAQHFIGTRWVDVNKGTAANPSIRCRLVAKEIARDHRDDLFSPTHSLESFKVLLSRLATSRRRYRLMVLDIKKAFLHATMSRGVYIQLPPEEYVEGKYEVAKLRRALYGTRDAPLLCQAEVARVLSKLGFI